MPANSLRITVAAQEILAYRGNALILPLMEGGGQLRGAARSLDAALQGAITRAIQETSFRGTLSERTLLYPLGRPGVERLLLIGLGKASELTQDRLRHATGEALRHLRGLRARKVAIVCHDAAWEGLSGGTIGEAIAEGALLDRKSVV